MSKNNRQYDCYRAIATTLHYIFALSHNCSTLWRKVIAFYSYRSRFTETVIASYSYRSRLLGNFNAFFSYGSDNMTKAITRNAVTFWSNIADLWWDNNFVDKLNILWMDIDKKCSFLPWLDTSKQEIEPRIVCHIFQRLLWFYNEVKHAKATLIDIVYEISCTKLSVLVGLLCTKLTPNNCWSRPYVY
jgi:hypothetical protein